MKIIKTEANTRAYKISTRLLMQEALRKGYAISYFPSSPSTRSGITRCEKNGKELFFKSTCAALSPAYGVHAAENKYLTYSLLTSAGVPSPETVALHPLDDFQKASAILATFGRLVVKPSNANHGLGVSIGVTSENELKRAMQFARDVTSADEDIILQRQVDGEEYRFLVVLGKVIAVASRRPPYVVGDGSSTVRQLIENKNLDPRRGEGHSKEMTVISLEDVLHHKGESFLNMVLKEGEKVNVLETSNLSRGAESVDYTDIASPALKKMAIQAAESCFLGIAGVDIMTKDVTADSLADSYVIEVNLTPGIRMHQFPSEGKPRDVAKKIFVAIEKTARPINVKRVLHIGRAEKVSLPELGAKKIPARVDTGAIVTALWASHISETSEGLSFILFDASSEYYSGKTITITEYGKRVVSSSMGQIETRYQIKTPIVIAGRKIITTVTLTDRSTQVYPVLIGRNVLNKKFIVDVSAGRSLTRKEKDKRRQLDALLEEE